MQVAEHATLHARGPHADLHCQPGLDPKSTGQGARAGKRWKTHSCRAGLGGAGKQARDCFFSGQVGPLRTHQRVARLDRLPHLRLDLPHSPRHARRHLRASSGQEKETPNKYCRFTRSHEALEHHLCLRAAVPWCRSVGCLRSCRMVGQQAWRAAGGSSNSSRVGSGRSSSSSSSGRK